MDHEAIIQKYRGQDIQPMYTLSDGGIVVGTEIDENNHLYYVIKRGDDYSVELSWNQPIAEKHELPATVIRTTTISSNTES